MYDRLESLKEASEGVLCEAAGVKLQANSGESKHLGIPKMGKLCREML